MSKEKLAGEAWKKHCQAKIEECDSKIEVFKMKRRKWQALSKVNSAEEGTKIQEMFRSAEKLVKNPEMVDSVLGILEGSKTPEPPKK